MIFVVLRIVIVAVVLWLLWRLCLALFPTQRSSRPRTQDDWEEVLEAIDELPETTEPQPSSQESSQPLRQQSRPSDGTASQAPIEAVIVREAETALSRLRQGEAHERQAAYHEITTYAKLCSIADCHLSATTRQTINDMHRQARDIMCPPEQS